MPMTSTQVFSLDSYLGERRALVDHHLDAAVPETPAPGGSFDAVLHEAMRYSLLTAGKRLRPILCLAACEVAGGEIDAALPTALAIEMLHTMSLVHDDLPAMDDDDLRRGRPTNHIVFGEANAILAGDALWAHAFEYIARHSKGVAPERVVDVIARVGAATGAAGLVGGQVIDLACEGRDDVSVETIEDLHGKKTAALIEVSVTAGAMLGGADDRLVDALSVFGWNLGLAFQVVDDILDVVGTTEELGKPAGSDIEADKSTFTAIVGIDAARDAAQCYIDVALAALEELDPRAEPLAAIAGFVIERSR